MTEFHDWADIRAELHDGDDEGLAAERARTEAWVSAFHLAEERNRTAAGRDLRLYRRPAAAGLPGGFVASSRRTE